MSHKLTAFIILALTLVLPHPSAHAVGGKEAAASLILPTTGQAMNGELGRGKTKIMAGLEFGLVSAVTILGVTTGGGTVLLAATPLVANHIWSSMDAYKGAKRKRNLEAQGSISPYNPSLEIAGSSYDGVSADSSGIRQRIENAGARYR